MTRDEIISGLQQIKNYLCAGNPIWNVDAVAEIMDVAIMAVKHPKQKTFNEFVDLNKAYDDGYKTGYEQARFDYEQKWIPVTDRLPEEEGEYLITVLLVSGSPTVFSVYFGYEDDDSTKMTFHRWDDEYWHCWKPDVIAWRELPEPYKGDKE